MDRQEGRRTKASTPPEPYTNEELVGRTLLGRRDQVVLAKGDDIAPIPGTKRVARVEENVAADAPESTPEQVARLDALPRPLASTTTRSR